MTEEIEKTAQNKVETPKRSPLDNLRPPWKPGESGNLKGRGKGNLDFKTIFIKAATEVAKALQLGEEPDAIQIELVKQGIKQGLKGNFPFWNNLTDRLYGKVEEFYKVDFNPYEKLSKDELENRIREFISRSGEEEGEGELNLSNGTDLGLSPDSASTQGSGAIPNST